MADASRYRVSGVIHRGLTAEILEAHALGEGGFQRKVVIKRLLTQEALNENAFADEARALSQLHHANIVGIYDFGWMDGRPFMVLEYVDGADLGALDRQVRVTHETIPESVLLFIVCEVAHALAYAHEARDSSGQPMGIVHRDINPSNILIAWDGSVKLSDFGIALSGSRLEKTAIGTAKGTLAYMAPEQLALRSVDSRADIFALGCVLHRLAAGYSPMEREGVRQKLEVGGNLTIDPSIRPEIALIIERATFSAKEKRYASASEMARDCGRVSHALATADSRSLVREWLKEQRPKAQEKAAHPVGDLFDVGALLLSSVGHPVRRFESVPHVEKTAATELAPQPTQPTLAALQKPRGIPCEVIALGLLALGLLVLAFLTLLSDPGVKIDRTSIEPEAENPTPAAVARAANADDEKEPVDESVPEAPVQVAPMTLPREKARNTKKDAAPRDTSTMSLRRELNRALEVRALTMIDLENAPELSAELAVWRNALQKNDLVAAESALEPLVLGIQKMSIDASIIQARLKRVADLLRSLDGRLSKDELAGLEARYFEVRGRFRPPLTEPEYRALARDIHDVELEIRASARE